MFCHCGDMDRHDEHDWSVRVSDNDVVYFFCRGIDPKRKSTEERYYELMG